MKLLLFIIISILEFIYILLLDRDIRKIKKNTIKLDELWEFLERKDDKK